MPETSNVAKTKKEGTPQGDRAEKMARTRAKQQGIMKQLNELKAVADGGKASSASDKKVVIVSWFQINWDCRFVFLRNIPLKHLL